MHAAWWRRVFFVDAGAIIRSGRTRPLAASDAPLLDPALDPRSPADALDSAPLGQFWVDIFRVFFRTGKPARKIIALTLLRLAVAMSAPLLLHSFLQQLPAAAGAQAFPRLLLGMAILLGLASTAGAVLTQHWFFTGLHARSMIVNSLNRRITAHALRL